MTIRPDRALIVVPDDPTKLDAAAECTAYCERRGYHIEGLVVGTDADRWRAVVELAAVRRQVDVVVVPSLLVLDPGRDARVESLTQEVLPAVTEADRPAPHRSWRTRLVRRATNDSHWR